MSNTTKICPACGKEIPALSSFCPECGSRIGNMDPDDLQEREELETAMNEETPEVDRRRIDDQMAKRRESYQRALEERKRRTRRMIPLVALLVAGAIGGGLYAGSRVLKNGNLPPMSTENPEAQPTGESPLADTAVAETTAAATTAEALATTPAVTTAAESSASETLPAETTAAESSTAVNAAQGTTAAAGTTTTAAATTTAATATAAATTQAATTTAAPTTAAPTTTAAPETLPGTAMYTAQNLNVRSAPSGDKIGSIGVGESVQVLDSSGSWYKVLYNGKEAYVWGEYVKKTRDEAQEASKAYAETEAKAKSDSGSSGSSSGKLSRSEVANMSQKELRLARNEIYARHGAIFNDSSLQEYFEGKSWYTPRTKAANIDWDDLTATEQANLSLIAEYED